ncbi:hypothetical protein L484_015763 [Morus notabilis]|uniref:Uncharacterized protein n=2 Tax=Morus notabilis TaxID=981085 RepID=W9SL74_9ROSA|nr:hypothetical protein L484_015763 [Morus notabilis]
MDGKTTSSESWTDEKHLQYLTSIEASFVRTMLENHNGRLPLRLDRYLPDTSDSTLDLKPHQRTRFKHGTNSDCMGPRGRMESIAEKRSRRIRSSQPLNSSRDQVVPQLEIRTVGDKDEKDQQDNVPSAPLNTLN